MTAPSFPRQHARTRRFTLGVPREFAVAPDGSHLLFVRSRSGADPVGCVWRLDVATASEMLLADPRVLLGGDSEELAPEERARRERARESAEGVVRLAVDREHRVALFALSGRLFAVDLATDAVAELPVVAPVLEPRPAPVGGHVAYVAGGALRVCTRDGGHDRALLVPESPTVTYGLADFVAAEEIGRSEGYWWAPTGDRLLVARVDTAPVRRVFIADAANPEQAPAEIPYPLAGTRNAVVSLVLVSLDGTRTDVAWDGVAHEYLTAVHWSDGGLVVAVQSRDQRSVQVCSVAPESGDLQVLREERDPHWVHLVRGVPARTAGGALVWAIDEGGTRRLVVGDEAVTADDLQLRDVLDVDGDVVLFTASREPTEVGVFTWSAVDGTVEVVPLGHAGGVEPGTTAIADAIAGAAGVVRTARRAGGTTVVVTHALELDGTDVAVLAGGRRAATIASLEEVPLVKPRVELLRAGGREVRTALLLPAGHEPGSARLPVLLDPYGGPGAQRVLARRRAFLTSQWFADQGMAVVVADGRGTPGRGPAWERTIAGDLAGPVLEDQVEALHAAAERCADLDLDRVAVRGWSFGGYLAALAVLRRPDLFKAAVAGAPVTDWSLYDTHYTERYLGTPDGSPEAYAGSSILAEAATLARPLMVVHGLADDNVLVAHSLRLSAKLTAAGRPHTFLPLSGVTHMTPQEDVAENLLLLQLDFLRSALRF